MDAERVRRTGGGRDAGPCRADQLTLTTRRDNTLIEVLSNGSAQLSNGSGPSLFVGRTNQSAGTARRRGLLSFDLSAIVPRSQVNNVTLKLHVTQGLNSAAQPSMELFALLAEFGAGRSFAAGGAGDAAQSLCGPLQPIANCSHGCKNHAVPRSSFRLQAVERLAA